MTGLWKWAQNGCCEKNLKIVDLKRVERTFPAGKSLNYSRHFLKNFEEGPKCTVWSSSVNISSRMEEKWKDSSRSLKEYIREHYTKSTERREIREPEIVQTK